LNLSDAGNFNAQSKGDLFVDLHPAVCLLTRKDGKKQVLPNLAGRCNAEMRLRFGIPSRRIRRHVMRTHFANI